jgi:hypothetical protein
VQLFWILLLFFSLLNQDYSGFKSEHEQDTSPQELELPLDSNAVASESIERFIAPAFVPVVCNQSIVIELSQTRALYFYLTQHGARADLPRV